MIHLFLIVVLVVDVVLSLGGGFYYRGYATFAGVIVAVLNILALLAVLGALHG